MISKKLILSILLIMSALSVVGADTVTTNMTIGNVGPVVGTVEFSPDPFTVTRSTTVSCSATVSDNNNYLDIDNVEGVFWHSTVNELLNDNANTHFTDSDCTISNGLTSSATATCSFSLDARAYSGTWSCKITATDLNGLTDSSTGTVSTSTVVSVAGSGSGGGGGGTKSKTSYFLLIEPNTKMKIVDTSSSFSKLEFVTNKEVKNVKIEAKSTPKPASVKTPSGKVFEYIEIKHPNLDNKDLEEASLSFKVLKSWLVSGNMDEDTITLQRYTTNWQKLKTKKVTDDNKYIYLSAKSPGFSIFAITAEEKVVETAPIIEELPKEVQAPSQAPATEEMDEDVEVSNILTGAVLGFDKEQGKRVAQILLVLMSILLVTYLIFRSKVGKGKGLSYNLPPNSNRLNTYVKDRFKEGHRPSKVAEHLLLQGWKKKKINRAIKRNK